MKTEEKENLEDARRAIEDTTVDFYWHRCSRLSNDQIWQIIDGQGDDLADEILEDNFEYIWRLENGVRISVAEDYGVKKEDLEDVYPIINYSIDSLVQNTSGYIAVYLDIEHDVYYEEYEDVEDELEALGINPHDMDKDWPNIKRENGLISSNDLQTLWINCCYSGDYLALLDCSAILELFLAGKTPSILKSEANITIYNCYLGSGSAIVKTAADFKMGTEPTFHDGIHGYGVQQCYALVDSAWNGVLEEESNDELSERIATSE